MRRLRHNHASRNTELEKLKLQREVLGVKEKVLKDRLQAYGVEVHMLRLCIAN